MEPPSIAVVRRVAEREGIEPATLHPPLWTAVDPEALDRVVDRGDGLRSIRFAYLDYRVTVDGDGSVRVEPEDSPSVDGR